jgi:hypothetical protein
MIPGNVSTTDGWTGATVDIHPGRRRTDETDRADDACAPVGAIENITHARLIRTTSYFSTVAIHSGNRWPL